MPTYTQFFKKMETTPITVTMTEIVLPNDTNPLGILLGGRLLYWMDIAAAICAQNFTGRITVTASIDSISFDCPVKIGETVYVFARPTRTFNTSLEIFVEVYKKAYDSKVRQKTNEAYFTFVALDEQGNPAEIDTPFIPETKDEKLLFDAALQRKLDKTQKRQANP